jgi:hypothetical protein
MSRRSHNRSQTTPAKRIARTDAFESSSRVERHYWVTIASSFGVFNLDIPDSVRSQHSKNYLGLWISGDSLPSGSQGLANVRPPLIFERPDMHADMLKSR